LRLIRFPQKALMDGNLRWNYSPLKEKAAQVAGWPFHLDQFPVLSSQSAGNGSVVH
jgi:hypothetical protein